MASIIVPLRVLGDNILIKMTSEGVYDVWCAWCASLSLIRRKILSPQPQGFFHSFDKSPNLQDWPCPSLSGVLYRPLELEAKPAFRWTTARRIFSCVYLAITGMYALCVWSLIARKWCLFRWLGARKFSSSGRTGAVRVKWNRRRWYLVSGVFGLVFLSCWPNKSMLGENIWWGRYTGDSVEALNIGAAVVAPTRQLKLRY